MTRLFLECTVRAALIVVGTAIVLYAMRVKVASVKHRVWTAVLLLMLALPFWIVWGPKAPIRILPANVENFASEVFVQSSAPNGVNSQGVDSSQAPATPKQRLFSTTEEILLGFYLLGAFAFLARLTIGTIKANRLIRDASVIEGLRASESCAAPVTIGCFRPTIVLPVNWRNWSESRLGVVLAHEREHVRRRDPLVQWLALLNRAVFWFHPAAWWLERELSALAEECCDAAVLAQGHDPEDYAETLMHMARAVMDSGARVNVIGAAMPGVRLPDRVRRILESSPSGRVSRLRAAGAIAACITICAVFGVIKLTGAQSASAALPSFEAASIKPHKPDPSGDFFRTGCGRDPGRCTPTNVSARDLIGLAYGMKKYQVLGGPNWVDSQRFDIDAKVEDSTAEQLQKLPRAEQQAQLALMLRSLLGDRFKLTVTHATKDLPVFALVIAKGGPKLTEVPPPNPNASPAPPPAMPSGDGPPSLAPGQSFFLIGEGRATVSAKAVRIATLVNTLSQQLGQQVLDQTGLTGTYDYSLQFAPLVGFEGGTPATDSGVASIFTALQEQLGLRLESTKGPVDTIEIDHIEQPTAN